MNYLAGQIFVYLLIAALWGFFMGWLIYKIKYTLKLKKSENIWKINVLSLEQQLEELRTLKVNTSNTKTASKKQAVNKF